MQQTENTLNWHKDFLDNKIMLQQVLNNTDLAFRIQTPSYALCKDSLDANITLLQNVAKDSGANILVALKGYSFWRAFENIRTKLQGATCSGVNETLLAFDSIATPLMQQDSNIKEVIKALLPYLKNISKNPTIKPSHAQIIESLFNNLDTTLENQDNYQALCKEIPYALLNMFIHKEICVFAPAYKESQMQNILPYATHIIFNSLGQWERFKPFIESQNKLIKEFYQILLE